MLITKCNLHTVFFTLLLLTLLLLIRFTTLTTLTFSATAPTSFLFRRGTFDDPLVEDYDPSLFPPRYTKGASLTQSSLPAGSTLQCLRTGDRSTLRTPPNGTEVQLNAQLAAARALDTPDPQLVKQLEGELDYLHRFHFAQTADVILARVARVLDAAGIEFWLSMGSLLGWYRECDWLMHEHDVDLMLFADAFSGWSEARFRREVVDPLSEVLSEFAYVNDAKLHWWPKLNKVHVGDDDSDDDVGASIIQLLYRAYGHDDPRHLRHGHLQWIDFFFVHKRPGLYWWTSHNDGDILFKWRPFHLCWTLFRNVRVRVPCTVEQMLADNHGHGWVAPVELPDEAHLRRVVYPNFVNMPESTYYHQVARVPPRRIQ